MWYFGALDSDRIVELILIVEGNLVWFRVSLGIVCESSFRVGVYCVYRKILNIVIENKKRGIFCKVV